MALAPISHCSISAVVLCNRCRNKRVFSVTPLDRRLWNLYMDPIMYAGKGKKTRADKAMAALKMAQLNEVQLIALLKRLDFMFGDPTRGNLFRIASPTHPPKPYSLMLEHRTNATGAPPHEDADLPHRLRPLLPDTAGVCREWNGQKRYGGWGPCAAASLPDHLFQNCKP